MCVSWRSRHALRPPPLTIIRRLGQRAERLLRLTEREPDRSDVEPAHVPLLGERIDLAERGQRRLASAGERERTTQSGVHPRRLGGQVGSFVHPGKVPQMADTDELFNALTAAPARPRPSFSGLVLNEKGLDRALACGVEHICLGVSASDTHNRRNTGMSSGEALARIIPTAKRAVAAGKPVQVSVQSAFGCGLEGRIPEARVLDIVRTYVDAGFRTISLADTAGHALPGQVRDLYGAVFALDDAIVAACHFHDTYGLAMANTLAALDAGVTYVESAVGGLGGCPFTPVTGGNLVRRISPTTSSARGVERRSPSIASFPLRATRATSSLPAFFV